MYTVTLLRETCPQILRHIILMSTKIFVNLPVKELARSVRFFTKLGYTFNPAFTDEHATCMVIDENIFSMLIPSNFFARFTKKEIVDATRMTESIIALSCDSKQKVDEMLSKAIAAGGIEYRKPDDQGWMYGRSFQDLDGHQWEMIFMDERTMPKK